MDDICDNLTKKCKIWVKNRKSDEKRLTLVYKRDIVALTNNHTERKHP